MTGRVFDLRAQMTKLQVKIFYCKCGFSLKAIVCSGTAAGRIDLVHWQTVCLNSKGKPDDCNNLQAALKEQVSVALPVTVTETAELKRAHNRWKQTDSRYPAITDDGLSRPGRGR